MATKRKAASENPGAPSWELEGGTSLDVDALRQIVDILEGSDVTRLYWRRGPERLVIRRGPAQAQTSSQLPAGPAVSSAPATSAGQTPRPPAEPKAAPPPPEPEVKPGHVVTSPFVGTFYRNPAPDQPAFVEVGSIIKKGQVLCIIEAMKLMNEIESDVAGKVTEVLGQNGQPVEYGQALFRIEPV
jgi:acetyl-CoA carboxylase biotin carboxyl carrier protein